MSDHRTYAGFPMVRVGEDDETSEDVISYNDDFIWLPEYLAVSGQVEWPRRVGEPDIDIYDGVQDRDIEQMVAYFVKIDLWEGGRHIFHNEDADGLLECIEHMLDADLGEMRGDARCGHSSLTAAERQ